MINTSSFSFFKSQEEVNDYVAKTEELAEKTFDEETALELYKRIYLLRTVEEIYFVPDIVLSWEEMALSMISEELFMKLVYKEVG